jgi:UDP-N-acetylglucosamine 2-epimerase (non-hydrolysing)
MEIDEGNSEKMKIFILAGARPNFVKVAPLVHELRAKDRGQRTKSQAPRWKLIHTGQHYDYEMSKVFFNDLDIPKPDYFLDVGSGTHAEQTAKAMVEFEKICLGERPDVVVVVGDVNSTPACSVTAKKLHIKVAHVEAGLRSCDMAMPEEINRIVTDAISDYLFVTEKSGIENLQREGRRKEQIFFVGNIMIDTLFYGLKKLDSVQACCSPNSQYAVVTLHRPSNVDDKDTLKDILIALREIAGDMDIYFPLHPRTEKNIHTFKLRKLLSGTNMKLLPPLSYLKFLSLWKDASLVLTDSGGIQEETTVLGIPCFTIRNNTERPITIEQGTNILVSTTRKGILGAYERFKLGFRKKGGVPELWDGKTARRIIEILSVKTSL